MGMLKMVPMLGIDNESDETQLARGGEEPAVFLRDANNVDISGEGRPSIRKGLRKLSGERLLDLWHDELHGDTFGRDAEHYLVRVDVRTGTTERLHYAGDAPLSFVAQATRVIVSTAEGLLTYDGVAVTPFTIQTPPAPLVSIEADGSLPAGRYSVAVAWLRGDVESATSPVSAVTVPTNGRLRVTLPYCMDPAVDRARVFMTDPDGARLQEVGTFPVGTLAADIATASGLLGEPRFRHMAPMPAGLYLAQWQGRLISARRNVLHFSEPMALHINDPLHGFVQMPQRITFVAPVDGGVWVGQIDHVAFLAGQDVRSLTLTRKRCERPVPGSAVIVDGSVAKETGGLQAAAWLAGNGHVIGTPDGTLIEPRRGRIRGIFGNAGRSVTLHSKVMTFVR